MRATKNKTVEMMRAELEEMDRENGKRLGELVLSLDVNQEINSDGTDELVGENIAIVDKAFADGFGDGFLKRYLLWEKFRNKLTPCECPLCRRDREEGIKAREVGIEDCWMGACENCDVNDPPTLYLISSVAGTSERSRAELLITLTRKPAACLSS